MIDFKEHDGELFRMLDKPVPLAPDSKLPCLVRLIQDDSRMGMFNRDTKPSRLLDFYLAARIVNNNIIVDEFMESDYHRFEIIGYPVEEGSKEWALYQMMQGKKVTKRHLISHIYWHYDARPHLKCISEYNCGTLQIMVVPEIWITTADPTGWQFYKEPESPKSAYQVGDFVVCTYYRSPLPQKNSYERVIEVSGNGIVTKANDGCVTEYDINGNHGDINGWHIERLVKPEEYIIRIGCMSGTVMANGSPFRETDTGFWLVSLDGEEYENCYIPFSMLDATTRELVKSLLKSMQGDE